MQETNDFGHLYRAALAEPDPKRKSDLLRQVQSILMKWRDTATLSETNEAPGDFFANSNA